MSHSDMNVEPTAQKIDEMVYLAERLANDLRWIAQRIRDTNNLEYASGAVMAVVNAVPNFRLDLMVTRPMREMTKHLKDDAK